MPIDPRSELTGIAWPAVPSAQGATMLAAQLQFRHAERMAPAARRGLQLRQAGRLLRHARRHCPAYRDRLPAIAADDDEAPTAAEWTEIPVLTRAEVQSLGGALDSAAPPDGHGALSSVTTSGATGRPVTVRKTKLAGFFWYATTLRQHLWFDRDLSAKLAVIRHFPDTAAARPPDGDRLANWGAAGATVFESGPCVMLAIRSDIDAQVDWLLREAPDYLLSYPSNLLAVARRLDARGAGLPSLRATMTISEMLPAAVRDEIGARLGVPNADSYSAQEAGYLALQCPAGAGYHVPAETVLLEVLDDRGVPCPPGAVGRVVVTPLHNFATPLIRYDIGDFAEVGPAQVCPCGRTLPTLARIAGRTRNLVTLPDGTRHWPAFGESRFAGVAPVRQHQFVQRTVDEVEARLVVDRPITAGEEERLARIIQDRLGYPFAIAFTYHDDIPRGAGDKYEEFVSLLDAGG